MKLARRLALCLAAAILATPAVAQVADQVKVEGGAIDGMGRQASGVRIFRGIPYARPPVGALRWTAPQPAQSWRGVRPAKTFAAQCMQQPLYTDMMFRSSGVSEDCLYLNVWTPARAATEKLPVLVYFYGGGFRAGDGSELRYDGEATAAKGVVVVTLNYRLGAFGFFAHPELTAESPNRASGNYGLLDQAAALRWVKANIKAFGGDPNRITIAGESAGSFSVSAQMASPLSKGLIAGAIGESGSLVGLRPLTARSEAEAEGVRFGQAVGAPNLAALRALPAERLLTLAAENNLRTGPNVDGWFFPRQPREIYAAGEQARVPLLAGANSQEGGAEAILGKGPVTVAAWREAVGQRFGASAPAILAAYPTASDADVEAAARTLASDSFISYSTWKWFDLHRATGQPSYYYFYARPRPATKAEPDAPRPQGAVHSAEIEYALGNLDLNPVYAWTSEDREVSRVMNGYFVNFIKKGDPNGPGLPAWPAAGGTRYSQMVIDASSRAEPAAAMDARYRALEAALAQP
ncbi:carboxylesterase/lipase family protein [Phenylobacterium deserti]|uniref:Carboxylic ester hydrolase n=1 Tax=Phenylobacterium deserti TaxID=1914756 RepID=A0A328AP22_9CAUL|nr:carboxylesterase family protein [Phenylobacterium deserti]RAK56700.1 carboxylesterase family protein [Phenylobacterium deserti]